MRGIKHSHIASRSILPMIPLASILRALHPFGLPPQKRETKGFEVRGKHALLCSPRVYASTKWVMVLGQIYQLLHFRRRLAGSPSSRPCLVPDLSGPVRFGTHRLSCKRVGEAEKSLRFPFVGDQYGMKGSSFSLFRESSEDENYDGSEFSVAHALINGFLIQYTFGKIEFCSPSFRFQLYNCSI